MQTSPIRYNINRDILECKVSRVDAQMVTDKILIETYWNVKVEAVMQTGVTAEHINRDILECKGRYSNATGGCPVILIETYWNVKAGVATGTVWINIY